MRRGVGGRGYNQNFLFAQDADEVLRTQDGVNLQPLTCNFVIEWKAKDARS
jgi:hypothetical protein